MAILSILLTVIIIAVSILMVLIVLIQRPKQEGLGAAFGGGTLDSALGAHTTDVLQKFTSTLGVIFFLSAIGLAMVKTREFRASAASNVLEGVQAKQPEFPGLPAEFSNIPGLEGILSGGIESGDSPVDSLLLDDAKPGSDVTVPESTPATVPESAPATAPESAPATAPESANQAPAPAAPAKGAGDGNANE